jgi:uncharacterized protein (TIGR03083 family)
VSDVAAAVARRTDDLVRAFRGLDGQSLSAPSLLPDWTRLTIACHLRYGAAALVRMTFDALEGRSTSYYPRGRSSQRPGTLVPGPGESPEAVVNALAAASAALHRAWSGFESESWAIEVVEPSDNPDLGTRSLFELAVLRLTEVEVHGTDLDIGLPDWSDEFVRVALPMRVDRLRTRQIRDALTACWQFDVDDGPSYSVTVEGLSVDVREGQREPNPSVAWKISSRDLLALLLGRPPVGAPELATSRPELFEAFTRVFPGP